MTFEAFWWNEDDKERLAHIVSYFITEEDPAGCDSETYHSYCGKETTSWSTASMGKREFGTVEEAKLKGIGICSICEREYNRDPEKNRLEDNLGFEPY